MATTEEEIEQAFQADFPTKNLSIFSILDNQQVRVFTKNVFGNVSFEQHQIQRTNLNYIDPTFFESSYETLTILSYISCSFDHLGFPFDNLYKFTSLSEIIMNSNEKLEFLPKIECPLLNTLKLNDNNISRIEDLCFKNSPNLVVIDLSSNALTEIKSSKWRWYMIESLHSRFVLWIADFLGSKSMKDLNLNNNKINIIYAGGFTGLDSLENLELLQNPIDTIDDGGVYAIFWPWTIIIIRHYIALAAFNELPNLRVLKMSEASIGVMRKDYFFNVPNITQIQMTDSGVTQVDQCKHRILIYRQFLY